MNAPTPQQAPRRPAKPLVMIVDDVPANVQVLATALRADYRIKVALDGPTALDIARREGDPPDLILLDVMMPAMSGHDVLRALRADEVTREIPVAFVTADTSQGSELTGLELGAFDYLTKPVDIPVLCSRVRNLLDQRRLQAELRHSELKLSAMLDSCMQFIGLLDTRGRVLHANRQVHDLLKRPLSELVGQPFDALPIWQDEQRRAAAREAIERGARGLSTRFELVYERSDGGRMVLDFSMRPILGDEGEVAFLLPEASDVTQQRAAEESIRLLANNDPLTGLPNRTLLTDRVNQAIRAAERTGEPLALMFVDLDRFKVINDTLGHGVGDKLLKEMGVRLEDGVRQSDTVARVGGDEFVVMLPETSVSGACVVVEKLLARIGQPCMIDQHELIVGGSIGIAMYPVDGKDFATLSKCADAAMYRAKHDGRNTYRFYTQEMHQRSARMLRMETLLRHAASRGELALHYQPQVELASGRCIAVEALLRWRSPELGDVSPVEFIPLAEETGLIGPLGHWVLRRAVQQAREWRDAAVPFGAVAVNVSAIQLRHRDFPQAVASALEEFGVPSECLEVEVTESATFGQAEAAVQLLDRLHDCGIQIAIDDFGTGYSSLSYLKRLRIDKLKIDRSFVRDLGAEGGREDEAMVEAIVSMARSLGLRVIAEGVETEQQLEILRARHCHEVQGFFYSRPLPPQALQAWLAERTAVAA